MRKFLFLFIFSLAAESTLVAQTLPTHTELFNKMMASIAATKTLKFRLIKNERMIGGKMAPGDQQVKMNVTPFKCYLKIAKPNEGAEVLYIYGTNDNNALVNPNCAFVFLPLLVIRGLLIRA